MTRTAPLGPAVFPDRLGFAFGEQTSHVWVGESQPQRHDRVRSDQPDRYFPTPACQFVITVMRAGSGLSVEFSSMRNLPPFPRTSLG